MVSSEWKASIVVTVGVALATVESTALWIGGNSHFSNFVVIVFCLLLWTAGVRYSVKFASQIRYVFSLVVSVIAVYLK